MIFLLWGLMTMSDGMAAGGFKPVVESGCSVKAAAGTAQAVGSAAKAPVCTATLHGKPVWTVSNETKGRDGVHEFSVSPAIGGSTTALKAKIKGETIDVFPVRDLKAYGEAFAKDPDAPFKVFNTPLFPLTNRLLPKDYRAGMELKRFDTFKADVEGVEVKMPLNNSASAPRAVPHHLHGLLYGKPTADVAYLEGKAPALRTVHRDFFGGLWTGQAEVAIEQSVSADGVFRYSMEAKNTGRTPLPVGFGSHPYFKMPSGDPAAMKLVIPARRTAVIDNLENVLPTGAIQGLVDLANPLNFNREAPGTIQGKFIDNYFFVEPGVRVELIDTKKKVKYRISGQTPNIVGVQVFYPAKGDVIAIELVTNHPDPRRELWKKEPTGMKVLAPGESAKYAYTIEVLPASAGD